MADISEKHPTSTELAAFLNGQVKSESVDAIERHLQSCASCCEVLKTIPDDRFTKLAQRAANLVVEESSVQSSSATAEPRSDDIPEPLRMIQRYEVVERIGRGGMGDVFRAKHKLMNRSVALKVIKQDLMEHPSAVKRFQNEVRAAAAISHPNIVVSYDAEVANGLHFLVMELVEGTSLDKQVDEKGPLSIELALDVAEQAAKGLQAANQNGLVHRDIKPQNLMMTNSGVVKILDFGLAQIQSIQAESATRTISPQAGVETSPALTGTNLAVGTPDYLAPEQVKDSGQVDIRTDIYSLGCTLYFLLSGQSPYPNGTSIEKIAQHLMSKPESLKQLVPGITPEALSLIENMMAKDPSDRFQTPEELLTAIASTKEAASGISKPPLLNTSHGHAKRKSDLRKSVSRRRFTTVAGLVTLAIILLAASVLLIMNSFSKPHLLLVAPAKPFFGDYEAVKTEAKRRGFDLSFAANEKTVVPVSTEKHDGFQADYLLSEVNVNDFDAIIFIGGHTNLLTSGKALDDVNKIVYQARTKDITLVGVCMGIDVLQEAEMVREILSDAKNHRLGEFKGIRTAVSYEDTAELLDRIFD